MLVQGQLVVKLDRRRIDVLVSSGDGERFDPGHGRLMKEWLVVESASDDDWLALATEFGSSWLPGAQRPVWARIRARGSREHDKDR